VSLPRIGVQRLLQLVFLGFLFVAEAQPLIDTDLWWHLANGRYILAHGIPSVDVYSHTAVGHPWVVHEWLADVTFYGVYQGLGIAGLVLLSAVVITLAGWMVYRLLRRGGLGTNSAVVMGVVLMLATTPSWGARPQVINFLFAGILCDRLLAYRERPGRALYMLVPFFLLWANLHSGYVVGLGLLAVFLAGEFLQTVSARLRGGRDEAVARLGRRDVRRLAIVLVAGVLAGFATPGGYRTVLFPFGTLASSPIQGILAEWASPDFHTWQARLLLLSILVLVAGCAGWVRLARMPDLTLVAWCLAGLTLALTSVRHVPIYAVAAAPLLGVAGSNLLAGVGFKPRPPRRPTPAMATANLAILAALSLGAVFFVGTRVSGPAIDRAVAAVEPVAATDYLLTHHLPGELYNDYSYGGWLIWKAQPDYPVYIDGRTEVYGDATFNEYLITNQLNDGWQEPLDRHGVRTVMIGNGDRLKFLLEAKGWRLEYQDDLARIYTRDHV
jgi:hypothetical protein